MLRVLKTIPFKKSHDPEEGNETPLIEAGCSLLVHATLGYFLNLFTYTLTYISFWIIFC